MIDVIIKHMRYIGTIGYDTNCKRRYPISL